MQKSYKHMLTLAVMLSVSVTVSAWDFDANGLKYTKQAAAGEVWLARPNDEAHFNEAKYQGDLVVPEEVTYGGTTYKVTGIEDKTCYGSDLLSVKIGSNVKTIGEDAFYNCKKLARVEMPNSVVSIGNSAFYSCVSLTSITLGTALTTIGENAFSACALTSLVIPDNVTSIGNSAFSSNSLVSITIGKGLTTLPANIFNTNNQLKTIVIPDNVTTLERSAFAKCSALETVYIGKGVTTIGQTAFGSCTGLKTIYAAATKPATFGANTFINVTVSNIALVVPTGAKAAYQAADTWKEFGSITEMANIEAAGITSAKANSTAIQRFDLGGRQLRSNKKGLNIIKMDNGQTRKMLVK